MTSQALLLVLGAAFLHATWNYVAKRAGGGFTFTWLFGLLAVVLYAPVAVYSFVYMQSEFGLPHLGAAIVTGLLHLIYYITLQKGYAVGDLSVVYPLARGTGPLIATLGAVALLGERPSWLAVAGALSIAASAFFLAGGPAAFRKSAGVGVRYGLLTGVIIASYTLWDKFAVSIVLVTPILLDFSSNLVRTALLTPFALRKMDDVRTVWARYKWHAFGVAALSPLAYILVLFALQTSPASYVAPAREVSVLIGTLFGVRLLSETDGMRKVTASIGIVAGVIALALG